MKKLNFGLEQSDAERMSLPHPDDEYYPSFHYSGEEELPIPKEGTMTIRYKESSCSESERGGKTICTCTIDVLEIVSVDGKEVKAPSKSYDEASSALDKLMSERDADDDNDGD